MTAILGFGRQNAGTTNAGFGAAGTATIQGGSITRDTAHGGVSTGARKIDPFTKDYVLDANGRLLGMDAIQQIMVLACGTVAGTAAVRNLGHELGKIDRITNNFRSRVLNAVTKALQPAIDLGLIQITDFNTIKAGPKDGLRPGQAYGQIRWVDLTTGQAREDYI